MKTPGVRFIAVLLLTFGLSESALLAQAPATPGPEHELLKKFQGTWTGKVKLGEEESTSTMTYKMGLGGLWLLSTYEGSMFGQKFEGRGMDTFDAKKGKYVSVWADSITTQPMVIEGTYDKAKKILTMKGDAPGPDDKPFKMVTEFLSDDHHLWTMYVINPDGKEEKVMTVDYTRKK
jgi:hypothetical protein